MLPKQISSQHLHINTSSHLVAASKHQANKSETNTRGDNMPNRNNMTMSDTGIGDQPKVSIQHCPIKSLRDEGISNRGKYDKE